MLPKAQLIVTGSKAVLEWEGLAQRFPGSFIFKGGTSLSKCYGLVERFSEDIDLLIRPGGRSATERMLKDMAEAAADSLGCPFGAIECVESGRGEHRKVRIFYPTKRANVAGLKAGVLLEMGVRGGEEPHLELETGYLLADVLAQAGEDISAYEDLQPVAVPVLHPGRTLLEKLAVVHTKLGMSPTEADCRAVMTERRPNVTYSAPIGSDDLAAFDEDGQQYEIWPCNNSLPFHAEVMVDEGGQVFVREWLVPQLELSETPVDGDRRYMPPGTLR